MNRQLGAAALPPLRFSAPQGAHPAHLDQKQLRRPLAEKLETEDNQVFTEDNQTIYRLDRQASLGSRAPCSVSHISG